MKSVTQDTTLQTWEDLATATRTHLNDLPGMAPYVAVLEHSLQEARRLRARRDLLTADKQSATQQLHAALRDGDDLAIRLRSLIRGCLGPRDERLTAFGMTPLRRGKGRSG